MIETNIFCHAPKELTTDAFITWLLYFLDSDAKYNEEKQFVFDNLLLKPEDAGRQVKVIKVERQCTGSQGRPDILLHFCFLNDINVTQTILFENKTWTTTSHNQLDKYRAYKPNAYRYIYLKLAYINHYEMKLAKDCMYDIISSHDLAKIVGNDMINKLNPIIEQYIEYINHSFVNFINNINEILFNQNQFYILDNGQAQQYLIDILYRELDGKLGKISFKVGSSFGRPWTQLVISEKPNIYGDKTEEVFWRIDYRSDKYYIRLNQYSDISDDYKINKLERLSEMRKIANDIVKEYPLVKTGSILDKGIKESEILIFFLKDNNLKELLRVLPEFSMKFNEMYEKNL